MSTQSGAARAPRPRRWLFRSLLAATLLLPRVAAAGGASTLPPETLLLALRVDSELLSDAVAAMVVPQDEVRLPVGEMARLLELDVAADVAGRRILRDGRPLAAFDAGRMTATDDDILAAPELVAAWLGVEVTVDRISSTITIHASAPLPFQLRRAREASAARTLAGRGDRSLTLLPNPYALLDGPFVDARVRMTGGGHAMATTFDLFAAGDLAGLAATAFVSGDGRRLSSRWLTLGRRDPDAALLGPLHAREALAGEVLVPGDDLVALPQRATGALLSSFPLDHSAQFDRQTLSGDLGPGEDVELYVNDALAGFVRGGDAGGHYTFADVPVLYGVNVFRLVFSDAHGRQRVETRTFNAGDTLVPHGEIAYRLATAGRQLAEVAYGMTQRLTVTAAVRSLTLVDGARRDYAGAGARATFGGVFGYADVVGESGGGLLVRAGVQTRVGPISLSAMRAQLRGFVSEVYRADFGAIASRTSLHAGGAFGRRFVVPLRIDAEVDDLVSGGRKATLGATLSAVFGRLLLTNSVQATLFRGLRGAAAAASGTLRMSRVSGPLSLHGEESYDLRPQARLTSATLAAELRRFRRLDLGAAVDRNLLTRVARATLSARHDAGSYAVTLAVEVPSRGGPLVRVEISSSVLRDPLARHWAFESRPSAGSGAVAARVFLDRNGNGMRDDDDPAVAGAGFFVNRGSSPVVTNTDGVAFLDRLPADRRNEILLSASTLEDPGWAPASAAQAFIARAGKPLVVDFPVIITGEINGNVTRAGRAAPAVRVQLLRGEQVVAEDLTQYDGYYAFTGVKPGSYSLRVAGAAVRTMTVSAEAHFFEHVDFVLGAPSP